ncbi:MAG: trypsin-like peptidase domain-containing protein [bacterium]|nr:trypsin-like peptidase domain-containing protein [bacterium]
MIRCPFRHIGVIACAMTLAQPIVAQGGGDPDEFLRLEPVLRRALEKAAPFVVTVETFGGTRHQLGKAGPMDGDAPPKPRPKPVEMPTNKPSPLPQPKPLDPMPPRLDPRDWPKDVPRPVFPPPKKGEDPVVPPLLPLPPKPADAEKGEPKKGEKEGDGEKGDKKKDKKKKLPLTASGFQQTQGKTSGIILTSDGWVMVSRFALNLDPTTILITVPGRGTFHAQRAGEDTSRGIALVKIAADDLPVPEFVDPAEVKVGQWAFALGRTFAVDEPTVHIGIVSAKRRQFGRAIQIDAYTSPANYGGAVVDVQGRVLGIAVPLSPSGRNAGVEWYDSGIGFATTLADIQPLIDRMKEGEILQRGWLGVQFVSSWLGPGAKISGTPKGGAAMEAGIRKGDIILAVDGVDVMNGPHLQMLLSSRLGGDFVTLKVRDKRKKEDVMYGPLALQNAPWSEQRQGQEDVPATFDVPDPEGGSGR